MNREILFRKFGKTPNEIQDEKMCKTLKELTKYFEELQLKERGYMKEILVRNFKTGGHYKYNTLPF